MLFEIPAEADFSIDNIPFGIFSDEYSEKRAATAFGDQVLDLYGVASLGFFDDLHFDREVFKNEYLNNFISLGKAITVEVRQRLRTLFMSDFLKNHPNLFSPLKQVRMHLPVYTRDYTDFYSSMEHAINVGSLFRDPANALLPNWKHLPVAYHGRASSLIPTQTTVTRPMGQLLLPGSSEPVFAATQKLDFELETAFITGKNSTLGKPIGIHEAEDYIFGMVLLNDWSARDIQQWEYAPLGPFLGKNFSTSVSPWIVTLEALQPFYTKAPAKEQTELPYLRSGGNMNLDIQLSVTLKTSEGLCTNISRSNSKYLYWDMAQQLAHHTVNGCNVSIGDLMGSGTISGPEPGSEGSLLELTRNGAVPMKLSDGRERTFLQDYDTVIFNGFAKRGGIRVGFGALSNTVIPSPVYSKNH